MAENDGVMAERTPGPCEYVSQADERGQPVPYYRGLIALVSYEGGGGYLAVVTKDGRTVSKDEWEANAAFIAKSWNMHDRLLVALQGLDEASELIRNAWDQEDAYRIFEQAQQNARALLAEAEQQP